VQKAHKGWDTRGIGLPGEEHMREDKGKYRGLSAAALRAFGRDDVVDEF